MSLLDYTNVLIKKRYPKEIFGSIYIYMNKTLASWPYQRTVIETDRAYYVDRRGDIGHLFMVFFVLLGLVLGVVYLDSKFYGGYLLVAIVLGWILVCLVTYIVTMFLFKVRFISRHQKGRFDLTNNGQLVLKSERSQELEKDDCVYPFYVGNELRGDFFLLRTTN